MVMICCHNFKDETIIKRWQVGQKMNGMNGKFKDKNKWSNYQKLFSFVLRSCVFLMF